MGKSMLRLLETPVAKKCHKNLMEDQDNTQKILSKSKIILKFLIFQSLLSRFLGILFKCIKELSTPKTGC